MRSARTIATRHSTIGLLFVLLTTALSANGQVCGGLSGPFFESAPDGFEDDDLRGEAGALFVVENEEQTHTFHDATDEDWFVFAGAMGKSHDFKFDSIGPLIGGPSGNGAGLSIVIFDPADAVQLQVPALDIQDFICFGDALMFSFIPAADSLYYMRVNRDRTDIFGADASYRVGVIVNVGLDPGFLRATFLDEDTMAPVDQVSVIVNGSPITVSDKTGLAKATDTQGNFSASTEHDDYLSKNFDYNLLPLQVTDVTIRLKFNDQIFVDGFENLID